MSKHLIFIYKAKGDIAHKLLDFGHKIISPQTYQCDLCALTYGYFSMKHEWAEYVDALRSQGIIVSFCYEEQAASFGYSVDDLPVVAMQEDGGAVQTLITRDTLATLQNVSDLQKIITSRLA